MSVQGAHSSVRRFGETTITPAAARCSIFFCLLVQCLSIRISQPFGTNGTRRGKKLFRRCTQIVSQRSTRLNSMVIVVESRVSFVREEENVGVRRTGREPREVEDTVSRAFSGRRIFN